MLKRLLLAYTIINAAAFFSIRFVWSGIIDVTGVDVLPLLLQIFSVILIGLAILRLTVIKKKWFGIVILVFSVIITLLTGYVMIEVIDLFSYFARNFMIILLLVVLMIGLVFLINFYQRKNTKGSLITRIIISVLGVISIFVLAYDINFIFITSKPVVYAVEDEYQIVFETSVNSTGKVIIGDNEYIDSYNGSAISKKIHKVIVPMDVLDEVKSYKVEATHILYRGPYSAVIGGTVVSHENEFKPVDELDGINYYMLSDTHDQKNASLKAASYFGDTLDFIILNGDISSFLEFKENLSFINHLAYDATKGRIPVIYARGNHEVKGKHAAILHEYVGAKNESFYYDVKLGQVYAAVIDIGEDHEDDWWEFYGTADFENHRRTQIAFLESIEAKGEYLDPKFTHKLLISHTPVTIIGKTNKQLFLKDFKNSLVTIANSIGFDIAVSGHLHNLYPLIDIPKGELTLDSSFNTSQIVEGTGALFPEFVGCKPALSQSDSNTKFGDKFTGLAISVSDLGFVVKFTNSNLELVTTKNPLTGIEKEEYQFNH